MATARRLTWDKAGQRWKKWYKGRPFYGKRGVKKTDEDDYRRSLEEFEQWRAKIDAEIEANKSHRTDYETAIRLRQDIVDWMRIEGLEDRLPNEIALHDQLVAEIVKLNSDFARLTPPKLNMGGSCGSIRFRPSATEAITWYDRIDALRAYRKWTSATEHSKTIDGNLDQYLAFK